MLTDLVRQLASCWNACVRHPLRTLLVMVVIACSLVASTWRVFNLTWDEPEHVAAGMQLLDRGIYLYDIQHPTLARLAMALGPWLAGAHAPDRPGPSGEQAGRDIFYQSGHYDEYLSLARLGVLPFYALLLWATFAWARHVYGNAAALIATLLLISTPSIMGHAGFAALDVPGTATCTAALFFLLRWFESQTWKQAVLAGLFCGIAIASKLSSLPFIGIVGLAWLPFWLNSRQWHPESARTTPIRWAGQVLGIVAVALVFTTFMYGWQFRYTASDQYPYNTAWSFVFGRTGWLHDVAHAIATHVPLPVGAERFAWSMEALLNHNNEGHLSYLLGQFSHSGFRTFYLVALAVKTPIPLLLLGTAGLIWLSRHALQRWTLAAPTIAFVALFAFCSLFSHINIGSRHVFVVYPVWCIAGGAMTVQLWQHINSLASSLTQRWRTSLHAALVLLIGWQASLLITQYPDYMAYFNAFAGRHPEQVLIDSDLDWGQDVRRLQHRLTELNVPSVTFVYRGTLDLQGEHLPNPVLAQPFTPVTGWVAASVFERDTAWEGRAYAWLKAYTPRERIGKSIDLYFIPAKK